MTKIAIISDLHGNLPAVNAVFSDIENKGVDKIICLGDLIGKGPNSPEAIDLCREKCHEIVMGNWDKFMANTLKVDDGINYYKGQLGKERLEFLRNLPEFVEFYLSGKLVRLFHAHPLDVFKRIYPTSELAERVKMFSVPTIKGNHRYSDKSDIVGYGDIHWAYIQNVEGRILFNTGSVGNPLDLTMASYVVLEGEYESKDTAPFSSQFYRVPYDINLAIEQAKKSKVPQLDAYTKELKTAIYSRR